MKKNRMTRAASGLTGSGKIAIILLAAMVAGCNTLNYESVPIRQYALQPLSMAQISQAIRTGAERAGWVLTKKEQGEFVATRAHLDHEATCEVHYSSDTFSIVYVNSSNLNVDEKQMSPEERRVYTWQTLTMAGKHSQSGNPSWNNPSYKDWALHLKQEIEVALRQVSAGAN